MSSSSPSPAHSTPPHFLLGQPARGANGVGALVRHSTAVPVPVPVPVPVGIRAAIRRGSVERGGLIEFRDATEVSDDAALVVDADAVDGLEVRPGGHDDELHLDEREARGAPPRQHLHSRIAKYRTRRCLPVTSALSPSSLVADSEPHRTHKHDTYTNTPPARRSSRWQRSGGRHWQPPEASRRRRSPCTPPRPRGASAWVRCVSLPARAR